jgi:hypothetical protein
MMNKLVIAVVVMIFPAYGYAENFYKCVDSNGKVSYQGQPCPAAKEDRGTLSFRENRSAASDQPKAESQNSAVPEMPFKKSPKSPMITFYYNPMSEPTGVSTSQVEAVIREAASKWNKKCNVNLMYGGVRKGDAPSQGSVADGYVIRWDSRLQEVSNNGLGAAGAASAQTGVELNPQDIHSPLQLQRVITHELGHVIGIGHIHDDPGSVMSYLSDAKTQFSANPNLSDYTSCNQAIKQNYGIDYEKPDPSKYGVKNSEITDEAAARIIKGGKPGR